MKKRNIATSQKHPAQLPILMRTASSSTASQRVGYWTFTPTRHPEVDESNILPESSVRSRSFTTRKRLAQQIEDPVEESDSVKAKKSRALGYTRLAPAAQRLLIGNGMQTSL
ncbi:hypothetical protein R3P38DRAFT_2796675 [Favolaschia claudopus]|uniref:Uncharacterized protein n=1 Tax=Favolaschia claudopus TaxID=2862362 RepID=A0AAW0A5F3_9AGAR